MNTLRWALLIPAVVAAWYAVLISGLWLHFYIEQHACPPQDLVSGFCDNEQIQAWLRSLRYVAVGVSAAAVETVAVLVSPSHKARMAWITLAAGLLVAAYFATAAGWSLFLAAAVGGGLSALVIVRTLRRRTSCPVPRRLEADRPR
jgi:uncharacterized membrane protein YraQ (UPF0718 family)